MEMYCLVLGNLAQQSIWSYRLGNALHYRGCRLRKKKGHLTEETKENGGGWWGVSIVLQSWHYWIWIITRSSQVGLSCGCKYHDRITKDKRRLLLHCTAINNSVV